MYSNALTSVGLSPLPREGLLPLRSASLAALGSGHKSAVPVLNRTRSMSLFLASLALRCVRFIDTTQFSSFLEMMF